ncbi:hypothetical protein [Rhizobium sp. 12,4]|uniref:hypothetical protein n=1 Tax=Rhizobium sp. 12,4 TaxID=3405135 RepID=UPI003D3462DB
MRAIERTTRQFVASLEEAMPGLQIAVERSRNDWGRSHYVHIRDDAQQRYWKVRISDHAVGMRRALSGREDAYISAGARPASWAVWIGELKRLVDGPRPQ